MTRLPFIRLSARLNDPLSLAHWLTLALLLIALSSVALGLASVVRGLEVILLLPLTLLGVLIGWGLAASRWPGWLAGGLAAVLGLVTLILRMGRLAETLVILLWRLLVLAWQVLRWVETGSPPPDSTPLQLALVELWAGSSTLLGRLFNWLVGLVTGDPLFDPVAVALVWGLAVWAVAAWAGWMIRRRDQPLVGLLPGGVLLVVSMAYGRGNFAFLLLLLGLTWLLLALVNYTKREHRWQTTGVDFALDIRLDMAVTAIWLAAALVALAHLTPPISLQQMAEAVQSLIWGQPLEAGPLARSFGLQPPPGEPTAFDKVRVGGLPRRHLLGTGPELSERVVMIVQPNAADIQSASPPNYYWRSLTYDRYTGSGWLTGKATPTAYNAGDVATPPKNAQVLPTSAFSVTQQIQLVEDVGGLLHAAGALVTVNQPYQVAWRSSGDAFGATIEATTYQVVSKVPLIDEARLRQAGSRYPRWLQNRYLALPNNVPARVLTLARDLTATVPTPYERAQAIETYLRQFPYDLNLPTPPRGRDVVDYFLFDLQRGYCDYYATAMVVLARAAGLPARLVVGYTGGVYDPANARYLVTEADAHAWPEIYFPGSGWIEFEPTAARPPLQRGNESALPSLPETAVHLPEFTAPQTGWSQQWSWGLAVGLVVLILGGTAWVITDSWQLRHAPPTTTIDRLYRRLQQLGPWLAIHPAAGDTPYEFSQALIERLTGQGQTSRWAGLLNPAGPETERLTSLYVRAAYSAHPPGPAEQSQAIQTWRRLWWRLGLAWVRFRLERLRLER